MDVRRINPILTASEMHRLDEYTISTTGIPGLSLMANAANAALDELLRRFSSPTTRIGIFCGTGNNGGDGLALGHFLWRTGRRNFKVFLLRPDNKRALSKDAQYYLDMLNAEGPGATEIADPLLLAGESFGVKVDAMFGTGLDRPLDEYWIRCIEAFNSFSGFCISIDCPSGLSCTNGEVMGAAVRAGCTVTFGHAKSGFFRGSARELIGELVVADIGYGEVETAGITPREYFFSPQFYEANPIPPRKHEVHKGDFGRVLVLAGSHGFTGAAKMCALSALRAGAGLIKLYVPAEVYVPVASGLTEVMVASFDSRNFASSSGGLARLQSEFSWADFIAVGSGLSLREDMQEAAFATIASSDVPLLADAEGCFAAKRWLQQPSQPNNRFVLLTPHLAEFARVAEISLEDALVAPEKFALQLSEALNCWILLKNSDTFLTTPSGYILRPPPGSPALAKGGSGDILAGAIAARAAIALRAWSVGKSPYKGDYLSEEYYMQYPAPLQGEQLPFIEGTMRGYSLFASASHNAARLAGSEESVLALEVAELLNAETCLAE